MLEFPLPLQADVQWLIPQRMPTRDDRRRTALRGWRQPLSEVDLMITAAGLHAARGDGGPTPRPPLLSSAEVDYLAYAPNALATARLPRGDPGESRD